MVALALLVAVPMQLAAAAGVELAGGYDSTVLNLRTLSYGDGALTRGAVDLQLGHRSETVRQLLRTRGEYYFTQGEGRSFDEGDFVSITRYALHVEPNDAWQLEFEGSYTLGNSSQLLGRGGSPYTSFLRGIYGDYTAQGRAQYDINDTWHASLLGGVLGRHAVDIPDGVARSNMLTFVSALEATHDFNDNNVGIAAVRGEYFLIDGYLNWVPRLLGYLGWRHLFGERTTLTLLGGVDSLGNQNDVSKFFVGPYGNAALAVVLPEEHLTVGVGTRYEYAVIGATNCRVAVQPGFACRPENVLSGGTGRVWGSTFSLLWRPVAKLSFTGDVNADYGVTQNSDPTVMTAGNTHEVESINLSALAGVRFNVTRQFSVFARYNFLYSNIDAVIPGAITQLVRHVAFAGVTFALGSDDDGVTEPLVPFEELDALQDAAGGATAGGGGGGGAGAAGAGDEALISDPFDLSAPDDPGQGSGEAGSGWLTPATPTDPDAPIDPNAPPAVLPRTATQPATHGGTRRSTGPVNHGSAPVAPGNAPSGDGAGDNPTAPQGGSNP